MICFAQVNIKNIESTSKSRFLRKIAKFKIDYQGVTNHKSGFLGLFKVDS